MKHLLILLSLLLFANRFHAQELTPIVYHDKDQVLNGMMTASNNNNQPAILILPAWKGIDEEAKEAAKALSALGYVALIADIYGAGNYPKDNKEAAQQSSFYKTNYKLYQERIKAALHVLKQQGVDTQRIAIIGYCFGGTGALEADRANLPVQGVVSIHGGLVRDEQRPISPIQPKILVEHPAADKSVTKKDYDLFIDEMNAANADWQIINYGHCGHTFTNPVAQDYNPIMADRAWQHTLLFLRELFK